MQLRKIKSLYTLLLILLSSVSFIGSSKHKLNKIFEQERVIFKGVTDNQQTIMSLCYEYRKEIIDVRNAISVINLGGTKKDKKILFYINAYNIEVLHQLNQLYPIGNLEDVPEFFKRKVCEIEKEKHSLSTLRKKIIGISKDPKIHFCLYEGSISSPELPLADIANFELNKYLDKVTKKFINDSSKIKIKNRSSIVLVPQLMQWYSKDFRFNTPQEYIEFFNIYREKKDRIPNNYKVKFYPYCWKIYR
jgi:hypothetical protein